MKQIVAITFVILLSIVPLHGQYVLDSDELEGKFGLSLGTALPQGQFSAERGENIGGANPGLMFGIEYVLPFENNKNFYWQTEIRLLVNSANLPNGFPGIDLIGRESNWYHVIPTIGIRYSPIQTQSFELFASLQAGGAYIISPEIDTDILIEGAVFTTAYQRSAYGLTYALSPSVGIKLFKNFELNTEYIYGGLVNYSTQTLGVRGSNVQREFDYKVPMEFFNIWANYHFYFD